MERTATRRHPGPDLTRYLDANGPTDVDTTAEILGQAADALDAAHRAGVVHGELGPGAILLDLSSGTVGVREPAGCPVPGSGFRAPEVLRGEPADPAADVYAIGALLYHCLTGQAPRQGELRVAPLPTGVGEVVATAMRVEPGARHTTCADVIDHLREAVAPPAPAEPRRTSLSFRMPEGLRRTPLLVGLGAVVVAGALVAALLVGLPAWQSQGDTAQRDLVEVIGLTGCRPTPGVAVGGADGVVAAVDCDPGGTGAATISYRRYADLDRLHAAFAVDVAAGGPVADTYCGSDPSPERARSPYDTHGTYLGDLLCDRVSGTPTQTWTVDGLLLVATATGPDATQLNTWRRAHVYDRPWFDTIVAATNAAAAPGFPTPAESVLLDSVPEASRLRCSRPDPRFVTGNVGDAQVTAVACADAGGPGTIFYFRFARQAEFARFAGAGPGTLADCQSNPPGFSGSARYTRKDGSIGVLGCQEADGQAAVVWTEERSRTVVLGFSDDPARLLEWWRGEAGPV